MAQMPPDFSLLLAYWRDKRGERAMPSRADIDPTELPGRLWPGLMLLDVVRQGRRTRFRYRLVGGDIQTAVGRDTKGKFVDDVFPPETVFRDYVLKIPADVVEQKRPLFTVNVLSLPGQASPMKACRLTLPLSNDGVNVNMLLNAIMYEYPSDDRQNIDTALTFETLSREYL